MYLYVKRLLKRAAVMEVSAVKQDPVVNAAAGETSKEVEGVPIEDGKADDEVSRPWWKGNLNAWLIITASIIFWVFPFQGTHRFIVFLKTTPSVAPELSVHYALGTLWSFACFSQVFHSPSHGPAYRRCHVIVGRIIVVTYPALYATGAVVLFTKDSFSTAFVDNSVLVTGFISLVLMVAGYIAIRRKNVLLHKVCMLVMYAYLGIVTATLRIPMIRKFEYPDVMSTGFSMYARYTHFTASVMGFLLAYAIHRNAWI